ncbi:hypothetical protein LZ518_13195 [Sphingomonas sp. RB56-2]|uniref:Uncharacterized protein n=1 Tax=Sphingomonas brevis TaxID=2908206 RepID=A0ABT0SCF0_9SPHN|nr:hypothetical protein [Sphingomonas brevis]MCL6742083.1 hypothetical protein [Sphingomonas brevis]
MKRLIVRAALLSGAVVALNPAFANHSWGGYHWARTSNPLKLDVMTAITTSKWGSSVGTSVSDWEQSPVLSLTQKAATGVIAKKCTAIPGKILVCNAAYGQRGWLGIASIWLNGSHITQATTKLNDSYHDLAPYNTAPWRALVACQEIGHDFGLAHQNEQFDPPNLGSCMDYTNDPDGGGAYGPSNMHPNQHDYDQLAAIYSHVDSTNTSSAQTTNFGARVPGRAPTTPPGLENEPGDSPAEWGSAIHYDGKGRPDVFVKQLAKSKKVTHVFWAPGEGPPGQQKHHDD